MAFCSDTSSDTIFSSNNSFDSFMSMCDREDDEVGDVLAALVQTRSKPRRWLNSVKRRNCDSAYLELLNELKHSDPGGFRNYLRMDIASFKYLLELVRPRIEKKVTNWRRPIPAEERLALTLRFLATGENRLF